MSEDAKLACKVLAGIPPSKRGYQYLKKVLAARFPPQVYVDDSAEARAVRAIGECMRAGVIAMIKGDLVARLDLERWMGRA